MTYVDDSERVYEIVASEFLIGETTKTEVENALADGIFGDLDCDDDYYVDSIIVCEALGSSAIFMPVYYRILLVFRGNILTEIKIDFFHPHYL